MVETKDPAFPFLITDDVRTGGTKRFLPLSVEDMSPLHSLELQICSPFIQIKNPFFLKEFLCLNN